MARKTKAEETAEPKPGKAIKGFNADMQCRGFQFEPGKTYEHKGDVECCSSGFHACDGSPFDVWGYYGPVDEDGRLSRYADVTMSGAISRDGQKDSKLAAAKITVDVEISLPDFIRRGVNWLIEATKGKGDDPSGDSARIGSSGDSARIGSSGDSARIGSSGDSARIGSSGDYARIGSSGDSARIGSSGDYARIGSSGHYAQIGSSGDYARIGSSGHYAQIGSSGDYAQIGSSGDSARIVAEGKNVVIACAAPATVTAGEDGAICIPYHDGKRTRFAIGYVGEDGIEAGIAYHAENGKLVPVEG